jgi:hypothetical protein
MTGKQYVVHTVRDEPVRLRDQLDHIAAEGGRVVSVIWQPARQVTLEPGLPPHEVASGYVIVSEHELPQAAATEGRSAARPIVAQAGPMKSGGRPMEWTTPTSSSSGHLRLC